MELPFQFANPQGLYALAALIPLILLYLIRPRPQPLAIPSLMFFLKSSGSKRLTSFLKQITHDWLFLIQLLLLLGLALTFANPFNNYQHDVTASNTVLVIDVSASSQVVEGTRTRFDLTISKAKDVLGSKNTIILAKDLPYIALQDASADDASRFLSGLAPKATSTKLGEAIILAGETLGSEGRVIVISDFINTAGQDPNIAKSVLESKGLVVDFINIIQGKRENVGIIQMDAGNDQTTIYIKNYNDQSEDVAVKVSSTTERLSIKPLETETYSFKTPPGVTKIELIANDHFDADDVVYLSAPAGGLAKVLLITNNASNFIKNALIASGDFEVTVTEPPVIPDGDFDVYVLDSLDMDQVLPGTFEDVRVKADAGATAIVAVQADSAKIDYKGLLPVKLGGQLDGGFVQVDQLNRFTKNIDFGKTNNVFAAELLYDQSTIASVNGAPVMTIAPLGSGKLVYYGIPDDSDFKFAPHFPIFWTELLKFVTSQQDVRNLNLKTGENLILENEQTIKTPTRTLKRSALLLEDAGVYELEDRIVAANLLDEAESNINAGKEAGTKSTEYELLPVKETRQFHWTVYLLAIALFLLVFEVFFVKYRGDL